MAKYGIRIKYRLKDVISIVQPETLLKWHRKIKKKKWTFDNKPNKPGRPKKSKDIEAWIIRLAEENHTLGYTRISDDLRKIGYNVCPNTVKNILIRNGIPPAPRRKGMSWRKFILSHMDVTWATDFFTEEVWTLGGLVTFYVLFFVHHQSRRVHIAGFTHSPHAEWTSQQARNFLMLLDDVPQKCKYIIHDRDKNFLPFDSVFKSEDIKIKKTPAKMPVCNAYAERFVREARETLNNIIPLGERHFRHVLECIEHHHNYERPHQGLDNVVPLNFDYPTKPALPENVRYKSHLGGILNHYYIDRKAA